MSDDNTEKGGAEVVIESDLDMRRDDLAGAHHREWWVGDRAGELD